MAEFYRVDDRYLLRFPGQVDFSVQPGANGDAHEVTGWPVPGCESDQLANLYHNAIEPLLGNHTGGLFLHGSAVRIEGGEGAIAFLGLSRGGKTTLAGAFARAGHAFMTEDVIDLDCEEGTYWLQPKRSKLRLFSDSARHLMGPDTKIRDEDRKQDIEAGDEFPFASAPVALRQIYVLGSDHNAPLSIMRFSLQEALGALMPHAFILDVEDKARLRGHFTRMADLAQEIGCYALDYTRDYAELPRVMDAILENYRTR
ncbi:hypothetical protein [Qipengyuania nanhaisediminis]|uniref:hypothetical protein n=1 Tax=Qipengyuania nanhaisediminis TaxID=604088 RepID=UPI0038B29381